VTSIRVDLGKEIRARCEGLEKQILGSGVTSRPNYTGFETPHRYVVGYMGEFGFASYLEQIERRFTHVVNANGTSQKSEFVVWCRGEATAIEVKTRTRADAAELYRYEKQWDEGSAITVGARMGADGTSVELMGWIWTRDLMSEEAERVHGMKWREFASGKARAVAYRRMYPIGWLVGMLDAIDKAGVVENGLGALEGRSEVASRSVETPAPSIDDEIPW
jgi:hypothetical protein